jgi:hypothetical protein
MFKTTALYVCLAAFILQAILFNLVLYGSVLCAHLEEGDSLQKTYKMTLTESQYKKLQWINKNEFAFSNYLMDVKETKKEAELTALYYKVDIKEKDFLTKLAEHLKHKKTFLYSFAFSKCEAYNLNLQLMPGKYIYKLTSVSIPGTSLSKTAPPPKA